MSLHSTKVKEDSVDRTHAHWSVGLTTTNGIKSKSSWNERLSITLKFRSDDTSPISYSNHVDAEL